MSDEQTQVLHNLFDWISAILKRPHMFGISNVKELHVFIFAYSCASKGIESEIYVDFQSNFRDFVNEDFAEDFTKKTDMDWARLIRFNSFDGLQSIRLFERLYDRFPKQEYIDRLNKFNQSEEV